jgi:hypothetical protein
MNNIFVYKGSTLAAGQTGSVVIPGVLQYTHGSEVSILNYMGFGIAHGTITQSYCKKFDHLSSFVLEDAFHPNMRSWGNAHEALSKEYPEFGLADLVTLVRLKVDEVYECPLMPTQDAINADIKELEAQDALGKDN